MEIIITGRPVVKKNTRRIFNHGGKIFNIPSKAYENWSNGAILEVRSQAKGKKFTSYVELYCSFYLMGKYHVDVDNLISSVCDILTDSGIITDDDLVVKVTGEKFGGCNGWSTKVTIKEYGPTTKTYLIAQRDYKTL